jgi:flagellar hook protein FlgE
MMRSMFAGVSGLRSHQTMMDVVGNNIANVNTIGFKTSRVQFADALSQLLRGASGGAGEATAGINPQQVGLGVGVSAIDLQFSQGSSQLTGIATDVAIQGEGFFQLRYGTEELFTRVGSFNFDQDGFLVDPTGGVVRGWLADQNQFINTTTPLQDIQIPLGQTIDAVATTSVSVRGNLDAGSSTTGPEVSTSIDVIDSLGNRHRISISFDKTAVNTWNMIVRDPGGTQLGASVPVTFAPATGVVTSPLTPPAFTYSPAGVAPINFVVDLGDPTSNSRITQFGGKSEPQATGQNGSESGFLRSFAIAPDGVISGVYSNGRAQALAQIALANFANPKSLLAAGESRYRASNGSGPPQIGEPATRGRGTLTAGTLEMSNVELAREFTSLILAQRGFQASSRIITTSDEMIQELVNLRR